MISEKKFLMLNDINAYRTAFHLSNYVWTLIAGWDHFARQTIGIQFVKACDSVSANIAEGFGRYGKKDKIKFYHYSQGSLKECFDWNEKAKERKLVTEAEYRYVFAELEKLPKMINSLIKFTDERLII